MLLDDWTDSSGCITQVYRQKAYQHCPERAATYQPRARKREVYERYRRPGYLSNKFRSPVRAKQTDNFLNFALSGNAVQHFGPENISTKRERVSLGWSMAAHSLALRACIAALCPRKNASQITTQGGGNARKTRVSLPWADMLRPFQGNVDTHYRSMDFQSNHLESKSVFLFSVPNKGIFSTNERDVKCVYSYLVLLILFPVPNPATWIPIKTRRFGEWWDRWVPDKILFH